MAEIAQALVGLRQELKKDIADGLSREMTALRAEIRGITADAAQDQTMAEDIRGDLQRLSDSINQLGRQASPSQADALEGRVRRAACNDRWSCPRRQRAPHGSALDRRRRPDECV